MIDGGRCEGSERGEVAVVLGEVVLEARKQDFRADNVYRPLLSVQEDGCLGLLGASDLQRSGVYRRAEVSVS
jgi:hypothetical protein